VERDRHGGDDSSRRAPALAASARIDVILREKPGFTHFLRYAPIAVLRQWTVRAFFLINPEQERGVQLLPMAGSSR
jgi:hypothetical protein